MPGVIVIPGFDLAGPIKAWYDKHPYVVCVHICSSLFTWCTHALCISIFINLTNHYYILYLYNLFNLYNWNPSFSHIDSRLSTAVTYSKAHIIIIIISIIHIIISHIVSQLCNLIYTLSIDQVLFPTSECFKKNSWNVMFTYYCALIRSPSHVI